MSEGMGGHLAGGFCVAALISRVPLSNPSPHSPTPPTPPPPRSLLAADASIAAACATYKAALPGILCSKSSAVDDGYVVQYLLGAAAAGEAAVPASLSVRYLGRPVLDAERQKTRPGIRQKKDF